MKLKLLTGIFISFILYNCSPKPTVSVSCEKDSRGNYLLKWELFPDKKDVPIEIYISDNDTLFPSAPSMIANSSDYIAVIKNPTEDIEQRKYFRIKVGGATSAPVSNRFFELDSIQNFRDLGGYRSSDGKKIRWGKIFRSGSFSRMTFHDSLELNSLGVNTVIDLRSRDVIRQNLNRYRIADNIRLPISNNGYSSISQKVLDGMFLRGDAVIYTQDLYKDMVYNFTEEYADFFDYLCDENNYPLVYHCYLGKDQTGLATYLLMRALDIPTDVIEDDYMASKIGIDRLKSVRNVSNLSESRQEAFTMLTHTDLAYLRYAVSCIKQKSGSIDDYLLNEIKITPEKKEKLKNMLLH
ncbi:MAG: tyrosine-protein phosphatase [Prevotella sp.]|jgi:protein-tyrosine phosphatase|nr:tyrosine-protein phosphatase [Prevotella sp.]